MSRGQRRGNRGVALNNLPMINSLSINDAPSDRRNINLIVHENVQNPDRNNGQVRNRGGRRGSNFEQRQGRAPSYQNRSRQITLPPTSENNQTASARPPSASTTTHQEPDSNQPAAPRGPPPLTFNIRILSGSIAQIIEWADSIQGNPIFEVTGYLIAVGLPNSSYPPAPGNELNLLLRDRREVGPVLQVIQPYHLFPEIPRGIETGMRIRCMGKVLDCRRMLAVKISVVPFGDVNDYHRVGHVCRFTQ